MIAPADLRRYVIKPVCDKLTLGGDAVEELLLGTAMQESGCGRYLAQQGGPALGVWQMEPATHDDIWNSFLRYRAPLAGAVAGFLFPIMPHVNQLVGNLYYACAMARVQYLRTSAPIPPAGDVEQQAQLYKAVYNTAGGAATIQGYIDNWRSLSA